MNKLHRFVLETITDHTTPRRLLFGYGKLKRFLVIFIPGKVLDINIKFIRCRQIGFVAWCRINTTPHYRELLKSGPYSYYLHQHGVAAGYPTHCTITKFIKFSKSLEYLKGKYKLSHILAVRYKDKYYIIDGVHRASILVHRKAEVLTIRVVPLIFIIPFRGVRQFLFIAKANRLYRNSVIYKFSKYKAHSDIFY